jgi:hypothetical protein
VAVICLTLITSKPRLNSPSDMCPARVAYHRLHGFFEFRIEHVMGQVIGVEVGFDGLDIHHVFLITTLHEPIRKHRFQQ